MTTENNTNSETAANPATQTLFRFVSLRNPQLAKTEGNTKFIFRDKDHKGIFDTMLDSTEWAQSGKSKIDFLTDKIKSGNFDFTKVYRTEGDLKEHFLDLYDLTKILVESGSLTSLQVNGFDSQSLNMPFLWDSLIYQILTQEDFYLKELLTQMLQTLHYIDNYGIFSTEADAKKKKAKEKEVSSAKVVIPDFLFVDSASMPSDNQSNVFTVGSSAVGSQDYISGGNANSNASVDAQYFPTESMLKRQKVALASYEKTQLEDLKKDLTKAQNIYRKQYSKAYNLAVKDYQDLIKPLYVDYDQGLLEVEATFTEEMTEAAKKLALSQVAKPEVPEFQFEFRRERDVSFLQSKLSEISLRSFVNLIGEYAESGTLSGRLNNGEVLQENIVAIGEDQFVLPEDENQNFEEMLETINAKLSELNETIYQNTEVEKEQYASIGGVLIPVNNRIAEVPYTYRICAVKNNNTVDKYNFDLYINVPDSSWDISRIYHHLNGGNTNGYYVKEISGNTIILRNLYGSSTNTSGIESSRFPAILEVHLFFTNGKTSVFTTGSIQPGTCVSGNFSIEGGTGNPENPGNTNTPVNTNNSFVPKGFGIKRLGIADYLKVEQTTHAYVEGEVANIENIMAREYRSQSTRRLRRSETTETSSSDTERELSTDTTTSSRFEMQSEISKILQESTDMGINANVGYSNRTTGFSMNVAGSYASHRSKEDSMRQAVTQAQEVTVRALDRVVTKVHQERIEKMIEEFEENNTHGFDNRKGNQHVVGVYRWVDKLMKNQVWNYGKRMMFEFAIPQPSKLHTLAASSVKKVIKKPIDPRTANELTMKDYSVLSDENILKHWLCEFNVKVDEKLTGNKVVGYSFSDKNLGVDTTDKESRMGSGRWAGNYSKDFEIPENYVAVKLLGDVTIRGGGWDYGSYMRPSAILSIADKRIKDGMEGVFDNAENGKCSIEVALDNIEEKVGLSLNTWDVKAVGGSVNIYCNIKKSYEIEYQQKTFNAIIEAYEDALADYNSKVAEENAKASNIKDGNPMFYRQIEQEVLKHNSIAYLVDDSVSKNNKVLGKELYTGTTVKEFEVTRTGLDDYASLAKFMEQAFEWDIMSYNYYPYYWGKRDDWDDMYQSENIDPLFRSFLRSGMARVVVTVRPGFEDAVQFYMATGRLWNGGEVPVIGDPMYLSIVDEMKDIKGEAQGKPWITRLPTSLTILQAQSIGLTVSSALPFTKEDPALFENPEEVITESNFKNTNAMIESGADKQVAKIGLDEDSLQLTTEDDQVISELSLVDLKQALE